MANKPFFQGMTKINLWSVLRKQIDRHSIGELFESKLLAELIATEHHFCSDHNLKPSAFRKVDKPIGSFRKGHSVEARFENEWLLVSWHLCIDKYGTGDWLLKSLRMTANGFLAAHKRKFPVCQVCGNTASEEVDHVAPEFHYIAETALATLPRGQTAHAITLLDWWNETAVLLPNDSSARQSVINSHETAVLQAVCKACHVKNAALRRRNDRNKSID